MDISAFGMAGVAAITVICYLVGWIVKVSGLDNKWIPVIVGVCGGILGVVGMLVMTDFPAADPLTAAAVGIVSGLAATGVDQIQWIPGGRFAVSYDEDGYAKSAVRLHD